MSSASTPSAVPRVNCVSDDITIIKHGLAYINQACVTCTKLCCSTDILDHFQAIPTASFDHLQYAASIDKLQCGEQPGLQAIKNWQWECMAWEQGYSTDMKETGQ